MQPSVIFNDGLDNQIISISYCDDLIEKNNKMVEEDYAKAF